MKIVLYSNFRIGVGADVALRSRLYVSGWLLSKELVWMRDMAKLRSGLCAGLNIAIAFEDDLPVALALNTGRKQIMVFCRKDRRQLGYASACVKALPASKYHGRVGIKHSRGFWKKNQVTVL